MGVARTPKREKWLDNAELIACDLEEKVSLQKKPDVVVHMAGYVPNSLSAPDFEACYRGNVWLLNNLLTWMVSQDINRLVCLSSIDVYGSRYQMDETANELTDLNPQSYYAVSKIVAENLCQTYSSLYNIDVLNLRLGVVFGKGLSKQLRLYRWLESIAKGEQLQIYNPDSILGFVYAGDIANVIERNLLGEIGTFNLVGDPHSLRHFLTEAYASIGKPALIDFVDTHEASIKNIFDTTHAKTKLGFPANPDLRKQLAEVLDSV